MLVPIWMGICMASLGEVSAYLLPLIYQILDFIYWTVLIFIYLFWMTWHWKPAIVSCATTVFVSITQRASPRRCVTILPMEPLHYPLLVRQLIMPSFLLSTLTLTEGRRMGSWRGLWFLNEQSLQSRVYSLQCLQWVCHCVYSYNLCCRTLNYQNDSNLKMLDHCPSELRP